MHVVYPRYYVRLYEPREPESVLSRSGAGVEVGIRTSGMSMYVAYVWRATTADALCAIGRRSGECACAALRLLRIERAAAVGGSERYRPPGACRCVSVGVIGTAAPRGRAVYVSTRGGSRRQ